jgi:hypothetical protein
MVEEMIDNKPSVGFGINDCPFWAYLQFKKVAQEKFNDVHWVRLVDLLEKEVAYDSILRAIENGIVPPQVEYKPTEVKTEIVKRKYLGEK